jgi:hypothetical protein
MAEKEWERVSGKNAAGFEGLGVDFLRRDLLVEAATPDLA